MPPKAKSKKKGGDVKSTTLVDGLSTEDMSKDQLEEHIIHLREELDREREERSYFQLERDKIQTFWEISKRNLEETKAELRNRSRERDEADERHRVEIEVYKQKLKHVLSEQHNAITELNMEAVSASLLVEKKHVQSEIALHRNVQGLQAELTEKKFHIETHIKALQLKHQVEMMELTNNYERRIIDIEVKYHKKMQMMIKEEEKRRQAAVTELDERMKSREVALIEEHERALRRAEEHFTSTLERLAADRRTLKELELVVTEAQKQQAQVSRELSKAQEENRRLKEALPEAQQELAELHRRLEEYNRYKAKMAESQAQMKVMEREMRDLTLEHDLLLQASEKVQQERDELLKKQTEAIKDVQQRSMLKAMLLERKLAVLTETLEKKEAQLCAALSASSADPTAAASAASRLEELELVVTEVQKQQAQVSRELSKAQEENRRLKEALPEAQQELAELHRRLEEYNRYKAKMAESQAQMKVMEREMRDLTLEHDLLLQASEKVQQERDELLKKQTEAIMDVQQRSMLKAMLLERKLAVLTETLEKKEAQLCAALSASSADQTAAASAAGRLEAIVEQKQNTIGALQEDLGRQHKESDELRERLKA